MPQLPATGQRFSLLAERNAPARHRRRAGLLAEVASGMKTCSRCRTQRPVSLFPPDKRASDGLQPQCTPCKKSRRDDQREQVIRHYGGQCECCGCSFLPFLTIDHIEGDGLAHRKEIGGPANFIIWLLKNGCPPGFRVLCWSCNAALPRLGLGSRIDLLQKMLQKWDQSDKDWKVWLYADAMRQRDLMAAPGDTKVCSKCCQTLSISCFSVNRACKQGRAPICKACHRWVYVLPSTLMLLQRHGATCTCCGEDFPGFLNIDHVKGGGRKEMREGGNWYKHDLETEGKYRTLCFACNGRVAWRDQNIDALCAELHRKQLRIK